MATKITITAVEANGHQQHVELDKSPSECPICKRGQQPVDLGFAFIASNLENGAALLQKAYRCVFEDCERIFISYYVYIENIGKARFLKSYPERFIAKGWEENINAISPSFVEIYSQAAEAESKELTHIAGPGYRKALEFLIKDWLIANNEADIETIRTKQLGNCITEYVNEQIIKDVAARASWLGNDEVHYYRQWTDKDINDLKRLIELTANWINMNELSNAVIESMPRKSTKNDEDKAVS